MAKKQQITSGDYKAIAKHYHEEEPIWECKNCFRTTAYGKETIKTGIVGYGIKKGICPYCDNQVTLIIEAENR